MGLADQVTTQFKAQRHFGVPANPAAKFVAVYYESGEMLIAGTGREMPPFLLFRGLHLFMSATGKRNEWEDLTANPEGLTPLALLDPRRVIGVAQIQEPDTAVVNLVALLKATAEKPNVVDADRQPPQRVTFGLSNGIVTRMDQADINGSGDPVSILFSTQPPSPAPSVELPP